MKGMKDHGKDVPQDAGACCQRVMAENDANRMHEQMMGRRVERHSPARLSTKKGY